MKVLVVNADDLGLCQGVNEGILETVRNATVSAVSAFSLPGFDFDPKPFLDMGVKVGIHFSLNFGSPVSPPNKIPSLLEDKVFKTSGTQNQDMHEIRLELLAQYEFFMRKTGIPPSHMNFHKHLNESLPAVHEAALEISERFSLPMRSKSRQSRQEIRSRGIKTNDHFLGDVSKEPYWTMARLEKELSDLPDGVTELMCHPGRNVGKIPGLWYLEQRDTETDTFTSDEAKKLILEQLTPQPNLEIRISKFETIKP